MCPNPWPFLALTLGQAAIPTPQGPGQGPAHHSSLSPTPTFPHRQLGLGAFPAEGRWQGVLGPFWDFVRAGCPGDLQEALLGFHVQSLRELRESQEYLCCER